jgi:hypothetical protein
VDRRRISVAVVNCIANNVHGNSTGVPVAHWMEAFIVEPSLNRARTGQRRCLHRGHPGNPGWRGRHGWTGNTARRAVSGEMMHSACTSTGVAAAAAEMALVMPLLLTILFSLVEAGNYFYTEHVLVKAVRDGARYAGRQDFSFFSAARVADRDGRKRYQSVGSYQRAVGRNRSDRQHQ